MRNKLYTRIAIFYIAVFFICSFTLIKASHVLQACALNEELDASSEGIIDEDLAGDNSATQSMTCKRFVPGPHLKVTSSRPRTPEDIKRGYGILNQAAAALKKYQDYRVALQDGYSIYHANRPQKEYHFTNWSNARLNRDSFDVARPTALLYEKSGNGYKLTGLMYTAPVRFSEAELNDRFPVSMAPWHLHTNLCTPPENEHSELNRRNSRFGLNGSISTREACEAAGGTFKPFIFNWMIHLDLPDKVLQAN